MFSDSFFVIKKEIEFPFILSIYDQNGEHISKCSEENVVQKNNSFQHVLWGFKYWQLKLCANSEHEMVAFQRF